MVFGQQPKQRGGKRIIGTVASVFFCFLCVLILDSCTIQKEEVLCSQSNESAEPSSNVLEEFADVELEEFADVELIPCETDGPQLNQYYIPDDMDVFYRPTESSYGVISTDDPMKVEELIQEARNIGLLAEDEVMAFNPYADFYQGKYARDIEYYFDESILAILWQENIDGMLCSFAEVKIADPSQFRRKLADDTFESPNQFCATEFALQTNAVVALNADYYRFRRVGITVFDRELYRFNTDTYTGRYSQYNCVDTLCVNSNGDFLYFEMGEERSRDEVTAFIQDEDIIFSLSFGPILVKDGEPQYHNWYPLGEINDHYSRAGIGQIDHCHYLYMALNFGELPPSWTVDQFAEHFAKKPVRTAYCLDGGQTAEVVFNGAPYNRVDYGSERETSDILFFVTAIPSE